MQGATLETGHTKIKMNIYIYIYIYIYILTGLWHKIISRVRMILDDFKNKGRRVAGSV